MVKKIFSVENAETILDGFFYTGFISLIAAFIYATEWDLAWVAGVLVATPIIMILFYFIGVLGNKIKDWFNNQ